MREADASLKNGTHTFKLFQPTPKQATTTEVSLAAPFVFEDSRQPEIPRFESLLYPEHGTDIRIRRCKAIDLQQIRTERTAQPIAFFQHPSVSKSRTLFGKLGYTNT